jgi:hypothetical protein
MNNIPETFNSHFQKLYEKNGFLDKYGGSVVFAFLTIMFFFIVLSYYYIKDKIEPIRKNWAEERCKPSVMPFAGIIKEQDLPKGTSKIEFTSDNFIQCTNTILGSIVGHFIKPFYYITERLVETVKNSNKSLDFIRVLAAGLRNKLNEIFSYLFSRIFNVMIPIQKIMIKFKDLFNKISAAVVSGLYTVYGIYLAMKSFIGAFLTILIIALIVFLAAIVLLWILPFTWPAAAAGTAFFTILSVLVAITASWMKYILDINSKKVPKRKCFDKNTIINTKNGPQQIKNIKSGTILDNGDRITAVFKLSISGITMYNFNNIIVSGCHKVYNQKLGWIDVKEHPMSKKIDDYRESAIYCISTESKRININGFKFLDWDELEPLDIIKLKNLKYISRNSSLADIHKYLESGLDGNILIEIENGQSIKLKDIQLNDQLQFNERVIGLVEIDTKNIDSIKKYSFKNFDIIGAPNIHFNDTDLGNFNTLNISGKIVKKPDKLYHLITDTGHFTIDGIKLRDYNSAIENILDIRDKLFSLF